MLDVRMNRTKKIKRIILIFAALFLNKLSFSQSNLKGYLMPTLSVAYPINKKISQKIDLESRNFTYLNNEYQLKAKHLEILNSTKLRLSETKSAAIGVRYRVELDKNSENEFRLHQQYEWQKNKASIFQQRLRMEERIYRSQTKFRLRYKSGFAFDMESFCDVLNLSNELMVELTKYARSDYEERLLAEAEWELKDKTKLAVGTQYRLSDFTHKPSHNIFITAGLTFNL